jgi:hypothetical protein
MPGLEEPGKHTPTEGRAKSLSIVLWDRRGTFLPINLYFFCFNVRVESEMGTRT